MDCEDSIAQPIVWTLYRLRYHLSPYQKVIYVSLHLWVYILCEPWPIFQFLNPYAIGRSPWKSESARRKAATYTQNNTNTE
jgi:hypothetical protein